MDAIRRCFILRYSSLAASFPCPDSFAALAPFTEAPYPAFSTAEIIAPSSIADSSNTTDMLFLSRFTDTSETPSSALTHLSTREEHAAQLIPVTSNCSCFILSIYTPRGCGVKVWYHDTAFFSAADSRNALRWKRPSAETSSRLPSSGIHAEFLPAFTEGDTRTE